MIADDLGLLQDLGSRIVLERFQDVCGAGGYVLHDSRWWELFDGGPGVAYAALAGTAPQAGGEEITLRMEPLDLVLYASETSGLQFADGRLLDVPWPDQDLIYVRQAQARVTGSVPGISVSGIYIRHLDEDGGEYYALAGSGLRHTAGGGSVLCPGQDVILGWEPVDVDSLLEGYAERTREAEARAFV